VPHCTVLHKCAVHNPGDLDGSGYTFSYWSLTLSRHSFVSFVQGFHGPFLAFDIPLNSDIIYILDYHGLLKSGVTGKIYKYLSRRNGMSAQSVPLARRDASWGIYKAIFRGRASS